MNQPQKAQNAQKVFLCVLCLLWLIPSLEAASPTLVGRSVPGSSIRIITVDGHASESTADKRGAFRVEVPAHFFLEIRHAGYRSVRSSEVSLASDSQDAYQVDVQLRPGNPDDVEPIVLQVEQVSGPEVHDDPNAREALPKSDRLFGLRGGVNVTNIKEGAGQQWVASSGNVFTSSSASTSVAQTSDFSAELGDPAATNDALPAGGPTFHGNVHYFSRDDAFNAKNFFDDPKAPIPPFTYHFFGGDAGGMIRDGTYLYSEYWGLRIQQSITRTATVPDPVLLTGNFSSISDPIIDPNTGFAFSGNRIPAARLSPAGIALARLYPAPNVFDGSPQNYRAVGTLQTAADAAGFRLDRRLSVADEMFMEYQFNRDTTDDPFNLLGGITNLPSFGVHDALQTQTFRVNNTHVFSGALIDQFRFSMAYLKQPRTILGDQNTAMPAILMTSYSHLGHATNLPQERRNHSFEFANDVSWQHAASQTKFGATIRYLPFHASLDLYSHGQYQFTGGIYTNNDLANLLLGYPTNALRLTGDTTRDFRTWTSSFYVQHEWQPFRRLSVNAGLRYDYQTPFGEAHNKISNFNPATGQIVQSPQTLYEPDHNNFGPRLGLAWQPFRNIVARAGYGIFYDTLSVGDSLFLLGLNPPFARFDVKNNGPVLPDFDFTTAFQSNAASAEPSIFSTSRQLPNPYVQQWSTSLEVPV